MYKAIVHLNRYTQEDEKRFLAYVASLPGTQYFIRNIWDIEPEIIVSDYHEYREVMDRLKEQFPEVIRNVETVLMKTDEWTPGFRNLLKGK
jgi:hypothetical protein